MKVFVTPLYKKGKPLPRDAKKRVFQGDLNVSDGLNKVLNRIVREARLFSPDGRMEIDPMIDATLTTMAADGFLLRGFEYLGGQEVAQEWWVRAAPISA